MKIVARAGTEDIAVVYVAETSRRKLVEFVESVQPPVPREQKWVLIVSTLYGCPVGCRFCDAGEYYEGKISTDDMLSQIDYIISRRYPDRSIPVRKLKIQFSRMGEPAYNSHVLEVLRALPSTYNAPGLLPTLSTVAPAGTDAFFAELLQVRDSIYKEQFQLQFSIHTTDTKLANWLMPARRWSLEKIAEYGTAFHRSGTRKVALNFALASGMPVDVRRLLQCFSPEQFLIKITPVNPTFQAKANRLSSHISPGRDSYEIIDILREEGYEVILSIGEMEENLIGSNCGQYVMHYLKKETRMLDGYTYPLHPL